MDKLNNEIHENWYPTNIDETTVFNEVSSVLRTTLVSGTDVHSTS